MSRTYRKDLNKGNFTTHNRDKKSVTQSGWRLSHKLEPYATQRYKFAVELGDATGVTSLGKLITRNANRSLKKGIRQKAKIQIKKYLDGLSS